MFLFIVTGVPIISPLVGQVHYATIGHNFSFSCLFDGDATVFSLVKDDNTEVQLDKTACYQSSPVTNYVVSCDGSKLTVTIPTNQVTETLNNTSWQCSDTVTKSQIYLLHVYGQCIEIFWFLLIFKITLIAKDEYRWECNNQNYKILIWWKNRH